MTPAEQPRLDRADVERVLAEGLCACGHVLDCHGDGCIVPTGCQCFKQPSDVALSVLLPLLRPADERAARAEALREAANAWTQGAWADTPRYAERAQDRIGAAQYVGDWLRDRADRIESEGACDE